LLRTLIERTYSCSPSTMTHCSPKSGSAISRVSRYTRSSNCWRPEGYFSPRVDYRIEEDPKTLTAQLSVIPGAPTTVASFHARSSPVRSLETIARIACCATELLKSWPLQQGTVLRSAAWESAKEALIPRLHANRFGSRRIRG